MNSPRALQGIMLMILSMVFLPTKDGFAKILGAYYSPLEVIWAQFCLMYLVLVPFIVWRYGVGMLWPRPFGIQVLRGVSAAVGIGLFYWAVLYIPLANTTAVYFLAPFVVTALSPLVLQEKVGIRRWTAVIVGFLGVSVILRPDINGFNVGYGIALVGGFSIGIFYLLNRKLAGDSPPVVALAHSVVIGAVLLSFAVPFVWVDPRATDAMNILYFIFFAILGQGLLMASFVYAPASTIAPFQYFGIVSATAFGYFVFGEMPDVWAWIGIAVICSSGIYIAVREGRMKAVEQEPA
jgi:drug/metabolite transporter (DMT)-like permease